MTPSSISGKMPKIGFRRRPRIGSNLRCLQTKHAHGLGQFHRADHAVYHRHAMLLAKAGGKVRHASAAQHDGLGAVSAEGPTPVVTRLY